MTHHLTHQSIWRRFIFLLFYISTKRITFDHENMLGQSHRTSSSPDAWRWAKQMASTRATRKRQNELESMTSEANQLTKKSDRAKEWGISREKRTAIELAIVYIYTFFQCIKYMYARQHTTRSRTVLGGFLLCFWFIRVVKQRYSVKASLALLLAMISLVSAIGF